MKMFYSFICKHLQTSENGLQREILWTPPHFCLRVNSEHRFHRLNMHRTLSDKGSVHPVTAMGDHPATRAPLTVLRLISLRQQNVDLLHQYSYQRRCNFYICQGLRQWLRLWSTLPPTGPAGSLQGVGLLSWSVWTCEHRALLKTQRKNFFPFWRRRWCLNVASVSRSLRLTEIISTDLPDNDMLLANMSTDLVAVLFIYFTWILEWISILVSVTISWTKIIRTSCLHQLFCILALRPKRCVFEVCSNCPTNSREHLFFLCVWAQTAQ